MSAETTVSNRWLFCPTVFPENFPLRWMLPGEQLQGNKRIRYSSPLQPFKFDSHLFHQPLRGNLKSSCQRHHDIKRRGARPFFQSRDVTVVLQELRGCHLTGFAERNPLDHIQPPLTAQNIAHGGLAQPHFPGEFLLGQTRIGADSSQHF